MRRITIIALASIAALGAVTPAQAGTTNGLRTRAHVLHTRVQHKLGPAAAGRDISTRGYRLKSGRVRPATAPELRSFIATLDRALAPPPAPVAPVAAASAPSSGTAVGSSSGLTGPSSAGYCGAYQFDQQTWNSVGGTGSPCNASPAEQDRRAAMLQSSRGNQPWPVCGRGGASLAQIRQCENGGRY